MNEYRIAMSEAHSVLGLVDQMLGVLFEPALQLLIESVNRGGKILTCGNGGGASLAQYLAATLTVRYKTDRLPIAAVCLAANASTLTAAANDYGHKHVFSRQVAALGRPGDVLVAISASGRSENVNEAVHTAKALGVGTLGLSGCKGLIAGPDVDLHVAAYGHPRIQEAHLLIVHTLVEELERRIPQ